MSVLCIAVSLVSLHLAVTARDWWGYFTPCWSGSNTLSQVHSGKREEEKKWGRNWAWPHLDRCPPLWFTYRWCQRHANRHHFADTMQMWSNVVLNVHEMWNEKDVFDAHYETGDRPQGLTYCGICWANRCQTPHHFHFPWNTQRILSKSWKMCFEIEEFKMLGLCSRKALQDRRNRRSIIKPAQQCGETLVLFFLVLNCDMLCIKLLLLRVVDGKAGLFWGDSLL